MWRRPSLDPERRITAIPLSYRPRFGATEILESQSESIEKGIYVALRMLNEQAEFARQMIGTARYAPLDNGLVFWQRLQAQAEEQIETLRHFLERRPAVRLEQGSQNVGI